MRVGLLCGDLDPTLDGVADYTRRLAAHLRTTRTGAGGIEPIVLTTHRHARAARAAGSDAIGVADDWGLAGVRSATRAIAGLGLDVLHVQYSPSVFGFSRAIGLLPLLLPPRLPLVVTLHEYGLWSGAGPARPVRSALWAAAERSGRLDRETVLLVRRASALLVSSQEHLQVLRSRFPHRSPPAFEVPVGLNIEATALDVARTRSEVRRALGAAPDAPLVVFFGFLHPVKALDRLVTATAELSQRRPDARLLLVGGGESHSVGALAAVGLRDELERVAAASGIADRVHFTGHVPEAEVARLLAAADVASFPFDDGVTAKSGSLLAAFAAGVPVVATAAPGRLRTPTEADGALRVPPRDTAALAAALERVLGDAALAARLVSAGREVVARHDWQAICAQHAGVYASAVRARRLGPGPNRP